MAKELEKTHQKLLTAKIEIEKLNTSLAQERSSVLNLSGTLEKTKAKLSKITALLAQEQSRSAELFKKH